MLRLEDVQRAEQIHNSETLSLFGALGEKPQFGMGPENKAAEFFNGTGQASQAAVHLEYGPVLCQPREMDSGERVWYKGRR
jgi:hypothetical protein